MDSRIPAEYVGWLGQLARADALTIDNGPARGTRMIRLVNGGGLEIEVHPDRGLDIGRVTAHGGPVAWISPVDLTSPAHYDPDGTRWLRTFGGGFLATCGLDTFGPPSTDRGTSFGQHGRIGATPAHVTSVFADSNCVAVGGTVRQASVFGEHLVLNRTIRSAIGSGSFTIEDTVTNHGSAVAPHMIMYHCNLGWPLIAPESTVSFPEATITPRDEHSARSLSEHTTFRPPDPEFIEQVFIHEPPAASKATVTVSNPSLPLTLRLSYDSRALPALFQWKMLGHGNYVLGVEPANTTAFKGRAEAHSTGRLPTLEPGESATYALHVQITR